MTSENDPIMINTIFVIVVMIVLAYSSYVMTVIRHEQKKLWREGKADYYGNPINKCKGGEDETK